MARCQDPQKADKSKAQTSERDASRGLTGLGAAGFSELSLNWNHTRQNKSHTLLSPFIAIMCRLSVEWNPASLLALHRRPCDLLSVLI